MSDPAPDLVFVRRGEPLYDGARTLRFEVLRRPLGFGPGSEEFAHEDECLHLVAAEGERVVGCVLFHPDGQGTGRLLQMAVAEDRRGSGVGRRLVRHLEGRLVRDGRVRVTLHARDHAVGFYEKLGYEVYGEPFEEVSIPHRHMRRDLP
ncbi:MAG: GNAT family N-acetyltransferase [Myxococcota bacterium]